MLTTSDVMLDFGHVSREDAPPAKAANRRYSQVGR